MTNKTTRPRSAWSVLQPARSPLWLMIALFAVTAMAFAACGNDDDNGDDPTNTPASPTEAPANGDDSGDDNGEETPPASTDDDDDEAELSGSLTIEGSSTVAPYTRLAIEAFEGRYSDTTVTTGELGSGGGISALINGDVPVAASSRAIRDNEIEQGADVGLDIREYRFANDALAIVVHPDNPVEELTFTEVAQIFAGEIRNWSEVGGDDQDITVYTRNEESGTFAFVEEDVIQAALGSDAEYDPDVNKQANAPAGLGAVANDSDGIFYAGLGNLGDIPEGSVKVVRVARDGGEYVEASQETVTDGSYPVARGIFYYIDGNYEDHPDPLVRAWIEFVLGSEGQAIALEVGFLPVN